MILKVPHTWNRNLHELKVQPRYDSLKIGHNKGEKVQRSPGYGQVCWSFSGAHLGQERLASRWLYRPSPRQNRSDRGESFRSDSRRSSEPGFLSVCPRRRLYGVGRQSVVPALGEEHHFGCVSSGLPPTALQGVRRRFWVPDEVRRSGVRVLFAGRHWSVGTGGRRCVSNPDPRLESKPGPRFSGRVRG